MSCPIADEIALIRGSGIYEPDEDSRLVILGSGEELVSDISGSLVALTRLEHARFIGEHPDAAMAIRWWGLRYAEYAGRPLEEVANMQPGPCVAAAAVNELCWITREIETAIHRGIAAGTYATATVPPMVRVGPSCGLPEMYRGLKGAVLFARGLNVGGLRFDQSKLPQKIEKPRVGSLEGCFPTLDESNPVGSCVLAAHTLEKIHSRGILVEQAATELARVAVSISREYTVMLSKLSSHRD